MRSVSTITGGHMATKTDKILADRTNWRWYLAVIDGELEGAIASYLDTSSGVTGEECVRLDPRRYPREHVLGDASRRVVDAAGVLEAFAGALGPNDLAYCERRAALSALGLR